MQLNVTARHLVLTPALSDYVHRKVEKAQRYFDSIVWAQAILFIEKHRHIAEVIVHTPGSTFRTKGEAGDLYSAIDLAAHKLDLHLSRAKDKQNSRRKSNLRRESYRAKETPRLEHDISPSNPVMEVTRVSIISRSVTGAIRELESRKLPFLMFINERTNQICAVHRKGKNGYGLVEAEESLP